MKILVVSDIHGEGNKLNNLLDKQGVYSHVLFLGDGWRDAEALSYAYPCEFAGVRGNCDLDCTWNEQYTLTADGVKIFMAHGHRHGVKYGLGSLAAAAMAEGATVALYGHTHKADARYVDGVLCVNPGHICYPTSTATYCELTIEGGECTAKLIKLQ